MSLPAIVEPVIAGGGPVAAVAVFLRYGPDAVVRLLAGTVAVLTRDQERGKRCVEVLRVLRRDSPWQIRSGKRDEGPHSDDSPDP
jgi:hypothetical protein